MIKYESYIYSIASISPDPTGASAVMRFLA